jgi:precorrin-2 dehydrogenase / sirohydrochlorin ferrochelatase
VNFRYPIFLDLSGKKCLVTGEGYEVAGKVRALVAAGAQVTYVNPTAEDSIHELAMQSRIVWKSREFHPDDLKDCFLVITDRGDNNEVFRLAEQRCVLCNAVDDPANCRFTFGSLHRQGDLTIAISTNGQAPAVAVRLKQKLEREIGPEYAALLAMLRVYRPVITKSIPDFGARRDLWYRIVDSSALSLLRRGRIEIAAETICELIDQAISASNPPPSGD